MICTIHTRQPIIPSYAPRRRRPDRDSDGGWRVFERDKGPELSLKQDCLTSGNTVRALVRVARQQSGDNNSSEDSCASLVGSSSCVEIRTNTSHPMHGSH